jgi:hypothetical protein
MMINIGIVGLEAIGTGEVNQQAVAGETPNRAAAASL